MEFLCRYFIRVGFLFLLFAPVTVCAQNHFLNISTLWDHVEVPHHPDLTTPQFTVEAWVNPQRTSQFDLILGKASSSWNQGYILYFNLNGEIGFSLNWPNHILKGTTFMSGNTWYHVAATYDGATVRVFVNGVEEDSDTATGITLSNEPLFMGAYRNFYHMDGNLDEVRLWNRALTSSEMMAQMNQSLTGNESGLVAYYDFNQGSCADSNLAVTRLPDVTGNGHDGTLRDFNLYGCFSNWMCANPPNSCPSFPDNGFGNGGGTSSVPTLSEWGVIVLALLVLCLGAIRIRNRVKVIRVG